MIFKRLLLFSGLALLACKRGECSDMDPKSVCIQIVNKSGQRTKEVILTVSPNHHRAINQIIENGSETSILYKVSGESSYRLAVILENGDTITSTERYGEGGYTIIETVGKDQLTSTYSSY